MTEGTSRRTLLIGAALLALPPAARADDGARTCPEDECGWVYDPAVGDPDAGVPPGTPFENLPTDWVCPNCGRAKHRW